MLDPAHLDENFKDSVFSAESAQSNSVTTHRSGGPVTPEGKSRSSKNSLKHGCRSTIVILPDEKQQDFDDLYDRWKEAYQPDTGAALELLEQFILNKWFLLRNERRYSEAEYQLSFVPFTKWNDGQHKIYQLALRYKTAAERAASKAQRDLEDYLKNRRADEKYRQQIEDEIRASHQQMRKSIQHDELAWEKMLNAAEARGINISQEKTQFAEIKEENRAILAAISKNAAALDATHPPAQLLLEGQNSPKNLRQNNTLEQSVQVTVKNGVTVTELTPSNQQLIERGKTMDPPPNSSIAASTSGTACPTNMPGLPMTRGCASTAASAFNACRSTPGSMPSMPKAF